VRVRIGKTMTASARALRLLSRAPDQTGAVVARVRPEQATLPTPCRSWDVRALVNHVIDQLG
jgi:Mycothiol maleylpyruvate isomerase N-terminal domain